jgi:hypothetical protein
MARIHGRNGALYVGIASTTAVASPVPFLNEYTFESASDKVDVTSFDDTTKTYVAGLPDAKGTYKGFYDTATAQLYTASTDGGARRTYLYPDRTIPTTYFFGTATHDFNADVKVDGAVEISGSFSAATPFAKIG